MFDMLRTFSAIGLASGALLGSASADAIASSSAFDLLIIDETPMTDDELCTARGGFKAGGMTFNIGVSIKPVTPPVITAPTAPVIAAPTAPVIATPTAPVIAAPTAPVIATPTAPVIAAPTAPVIAAPTAPVIPGGTVITPVIAAPTAPVIAPPVAPVIAAPTAPVVASPAVPTSASPATTISSPATNVTAPSDSTVAQPATIAPTVTVPLTSVVQPVTTVLVGSAPINVPGSGPSIVQTSLVPTGVAAGSGVSDPLAATSVAAGASTLPSTVTLSSDSTTLVINNDVDGAVIQHAITIDIAITDFHDVLSVAQAAGAAAQFISDGALLGSLN